MAVYGYTRVSTSQQADEGKSLAVQERQIRGWCMMHGHDLAELFVDRGVSGSIPVAARPAGKNLTARLRAGDIIISPKLDRLFRSALDALQTVEAMRGKRVSIHLLDHLGEITGNGMAKAFLTIAAAFAELERDQTRERVTTVKRDQKARGRYLGGKVPFGYRLEAGELVPEPSEQVVVATIRRLAGERKTLRVIRAALERDHSQPLALATISRLAREANAT